jgi:hypothetical protein
MANIDTLTVKPRNWLKKTGDAMIAGFLTLFQDPTLDMHAVTKRYVDTAVAGASAARDINFWRHVNGQEATAPDLGTIVSTNVNNQGLGSTIVPPAGFIYLMRHVQPRANTVAAIQFNITVAGAGNNTRIGVWQAKTATNIVPGTLLYDSGAISHAGGGVKSALPALALTEGCYWIGYFSQLANTTISAVTAANSAPIGVDTAFASVQFYSQSLAFGALPNPWGTTFTSNTGSYPMLRITYSA